MKKKEEDFLSVTPMKEDGTYGSAITMFLKRSKAIFTDNDGQITMSAPGLKHGSVMIKETKEELIAQVSEIKIIE